MGVSTDAILFYGIDFEERDNFTERLKSVLEEHDNYEEWANDRLEEVGSPVRVGTHCSHEHEMVYLFHTKFTAWRGSSTKLSQSQIEPDGHWRLAIEHALEVLEMETTRPIGWHLVSWWG